MKLLFTGDWHLRFKCPEMRLDESYFETQAGKVKQITGIDFDYLFQPGDFFDSVETPWFVIQHYLSEFRDCNFGDSLLTIPGQHDLRYHTRDIANTPLGVMEAGGGLTIVKGMIKLGEEVDLYSCWWGEQEIPVPEKGRLNILLIHRMVIQKKLWLGQTDFIYARDLLSQYPDYDLFVTGDNHQSFVEEDKGRYIVNCGSLMRSAIDQVDHKPVVYIYDIEKRSLEQIYLKVESAEKVLNIRGAKEVKERDEKLELFIATLKEKSGRGHHFDFMDRLYEKMALPSVGQETRDILKEVMKCENDQGVS